MFKGHDSAPSAQLNYTQSEIDDLTEEYGRIYDIPKSVANYTDAHGNVHPIWSQPLFETEHTSFDQVDHFSRHANCLHSCYTVGYRDLSDPTDDEIEAYSDCKIACYQEQLQEVTQ